MKRLQVDWIYRKILDISCLTILYLRYDKSKKTTKYDEKIETEDIDILQKYNYTKI